jgi:hypothetical protein
MMEEANLLCDRLEKLVEDARDLAHSEAETERIEQLKEIRRAIENLQGKGLDVPDALRKLEEKLAEGEKDVQVAAGTLEALRSRLGKIMVKLGVSPEPVSGGRKRRRFPKPEKKITPQKFYEPLIVEALREMGGRARMREVLKAVYDKAKEELVPGDLEKRESTGQIIWENNTAWARQALVNQGVLRKDSRHGIWELADKTDADSR